MKAQKAHIFLFIVFFLAQLCLVFSVIKEMNTVTYKNGLKQSSEILTKRLN